MSKVIAVANQKGGTSKTTTTMNLGAALAWKGFRVLLIDADPQGDLTKSLDIPDPDRLEITITTLLEKVIRDEKYEPREGILTHDEGMDFIPGDIELAGLEVSLVNVMQREMILKEYLTDIRETYDYILIDCMPSLGMVTLNALTAADSVLIPLQASYLPVKGLEQLIRTITKVRRHLNRGLQIEGILITMADMRTNFSREVVTLVKELYSQNIRVFDTMIPKSIRAEEASAKGVSIFRHDPNGKVAAAYAGLGREVAGR